MALTVDELRTREAAQLEELVAGVMAARRAGDRATLDGALAALVDFKARTPFPDLQAEAEMARSAAVAELSAVALEELARIADRATAAGSGFKVATMIAESGKKDLLFPALAATAARGVELLDQFRDAIATVRESLDDIDELGDVPNAVEAVREAFRELQAAVRSAS